MKKDPYSFRFVQHPVVVNLKNQPEFDRDTLEEIWSALEAFTAPEVESRQQGFEHMLELDVARKSPLVAYVIASRLLEPDIHLRSRIVSTLADLFDSKPGQAPVAGAVLSYLQAYLSQMRKRPIFALLQVADFNPEASEEVAALLKACSFAGNQLSEIITDHAAPIAIRRQAIRFTIQIGFLVAIPALERMVRRIEARFSPEEALSAIPSEKEDEASLLPYMKEALASLQAL